MSSRTPEVIRADEVYTAREFRLRAGLGDFTYREMRQRGLRIVKIGKKIYVRGKDWLDFVDRWADDVAKLEADYEHRTK